MVEKYFCECGQSLSPQEDIVESGVYFADDVPQYLYAKFKCPCCERVWEEVEDLSSLDSDLSRFVFPELVQGMEPDFGVIMMPIKDAEIKLFDAYLANTSDAQILCDLWAICDYDE